MSPTRKAFIEKIAKDAIDATLGNGLFASVLIAQACLEGRDGQSVLAKKYNNHFGIKAGSTWSGAIAQMLTKEYLKGAWVTVKAAFRAYPNHFAGFVDRCNFLLSNSRYTKAGVFSAKTPIEQAQALQKAGYATDPKYAASLASIIRIYGLEKYDVEAVKKKNPFRGSFAYDWIRAMYNKSL